jgi:arylformamidase
LAPAASKPDLAPDKLCRLAIARPIFPLPMEYTREFYEREYNVRASLPEHPAVLARWAAQAAATRRLHACLLDLPYGDLPAERLDIFLTREEPSALLVFIHGGYWRSLDKSDFSWIAPAWSRRGVSVALLNYGLAPQTPMEDMVRQVLNALAWLYRKASRYGIDGERIFVCGHSAGAHLAAMSMAALFPVLGEDLPAKLVKGVLAISGLYDLEPLRQAPFINVDLKLDRAKARTLSPLQYPATPGAKLVTCVGAAESGEFRRQTRLIGEHWASNLLREVPMPDRNHFDIVDDLADESSALFEAAAGLIGPARGRGR